MKGIWENTQAHFFFELEIAPCSCVRTWLQPFAALQKSPRLGTGRRRQEAGEDPRRLGAFHAAVSVSQVRKMQRVEPTATCMGENILDKARASDIGMLLARLVTLCIGTSWEETHIFFCICMCSDL